MGRKIFTKKNILRSVYFAAVIILGNIDFYLIKSGIAKGIVNAFKWLFNFMNEGVPNFVTNLLLVVALGCLVFLSIKIRALLRVGRRDSKEHTGNLRSDFEEHKEVFKKVTRDMDKNIRGIRQDLSQIYDKANGIGIYTISQLLGHADVKMTQRYINWQPEDGADAVESLVKNTPEKRNILGIEKNEQFRIPLVTSVGMQ